MGERQLSILQVCGGQCGADTAVAHRLLLQTMQPCLYFLNAVDQKALGAAGGLRPVRLQQMSDSIGSCNISIAVAAQAVRQDKKSTPVC